MSLEKSSFHAADASVRETNFAIFLRPWPRTEWSGKIPCFATFQRIFLVRGQAYCRIVMLDSSLRNEPPHRRGRMCGELHEKSLS